MAEKEEVKLLGFWSSPFVMRVRFALSLKGVAYENIEQNLQDKGDLLLRSNPVHKKVPVLIHDGHPVCESLVILEYIDEVWCSPSCPPLLPTSPCDRAFQRFWAAYIEAELLQAMRRMMREGEEGLLKSAVEKVEEGLGLLEEALKKGGKGKRFFGGDSIGYLDIVLGSLCGWMTVLGDMNQVKLLDEQNTPALAAWARRFNDDQHVKEAIPDLDKLAAYAQLLIAKLRNSTGN